MSGYLLFLNSLKSNSVIVTLNLIRLGIFNFFVFLVFLNQLWTCNDVKLTFEAILSLDCLLGYLLFPYSSLSKLMIVLLNVSFVLDSFNLFLLHWNQSLTCCEVKPNFEANLSLQCLSGYLFFLYSSLSKLIFVLLNWITLFDLFSFVFLLLCLNHLLTCWEVKPTFEAILAFDSLSGYFFFLYSSKRCFVIVTLNWL